MFNPRYSISPLLLANIKCIAALTAEFNLKRLSTPVLMELERSARELSAHASTSIEGNPLPLTEVKRILKHRPERLRDSEREVINYNKALVALSGRIHIDSLKLTLELVLDIHRNVMQGLMQKAQVGKLRTEAIFVNDPKTGKAVYLPPDHQDVLRLMNELIDFTEQNDQTDPLIVAGIFHRQMVVIHPFLDGNGRTTRLATKTLLAGMGLNTFPLFSFENYYNRTVGRYFEYVGLKGNYYDLEPVIDFTPWLEYFTGGIIDELLRVAKELNQTNITPTTVLKPYHRKILDLIEKHGFVTDALYSQHTRRAKATRVLDFKALMERGLIEKMGQGRATHYKTKS